MTVNQLRAAQQRAMNRLRNSTNPADIENYHVIVSTARAEGRYLPSRRAVPNYRPSRPRPTVKASPISQNADVHEMRVRAMDAVYRALMLTEGAMPRVEVRISGDMTCNALAYAHVSRDEIVISESAFKLGDLQLRAVVYHELVHAVFGMRGHDERCLLMASRLRHEREYTEVELDKVFLKYAKRHAARIGA